jgi:hypothetical protein
MPTKVIPLKNHNLGGIADSAYSGARDSFAELVGFDIHSEPGILKVNQKLTKDSSTTIDDFVKAGVACSDGKTYLFGSTNGKIWSRTSEGTYALEATAAPAAGAVGILSAREYQGYIYYAMQNRLGRWQVGTAWSTRSDNFATFGNGDATYHPMREVNKVLFIGDVDDVAQVDAGTFSASALSLGAPNRISALGIANTNLLIGLFTGDNVIGCQLIQWNTWSTHYTFTDPVPEVGINAFLPLDNYIVVSAGIKGNLYEYNGTNLVNQKTIPGIFNGTANQCKVYHEAILNFNGLPLFGLSQTAGTPSALFGLYSFARRNSVYPFVLNMENPISSNNFTSIEIGCIVGAGDTYLVAWKDTTSGTVYGVDKLDLSNKYNGAYFTTRYIMPSRSRDTNYPGAYVGYRTLPANTDIVISASLNGEAFGVVASVDDVQRTIKETTEELGDTTKLQVKISTTASGNTAPEIEEGGILVNI